MLRILPFVALCLLLSTSNYDDTMNMNINNANGNYYIVQYALTFVGRKTSDFANGNFIKQILFGHIDLPWTIQDLIKDFGTPASISDFSVGNIIFSKSNVKYPLIGIVMDKNYTIIPIENEEISIIHNIEVNSYFHDGYIMRKSQDYFYDYGGNIYKATLNNSIFCKQCDPQIRNIKIPDPTDYLNQFRVFYVISRDSHILISLLGYINSVDEASRNGTIKFLLSEVKLPPYTFNDTRIIENNESIMQFHFGMISMDFTVNATFKAYQETFNLYAEGLIIT